MDGPQLVDLGLWGGNRQPLGARPPLPWFPWFGGAQLPPVAVRVGVTLTVTFDRDEERRQAVPASTKQVFP